MKTNKYAVRINWKWNSIYEFFSYGILFGRGKKSDVLENDKREWWNVAYSAKVS